jgi:heat shock protein HslJ
MGTERAFLVALRNARKWDVVNGQLVLQGTAELRFVRAL